VLFEPSPFNVLSPWKESANMSLYENLTPAYQLKTPQLFNNVNRNSPFKSPFRATS
jgi:hypothetical protein